MEHVDLLLRSVFLDSAIYALKDLGKEYSLILATSLLPKVMISSLSVPKKEEVNFGVTGLVEDALEGGDGGSLGGGIRTRRR